MKNNPSLMRFLVISNIMLLGVVTFIFITGFDKNDRQKKFTEITAERINIINADGTPVIAISNKQRIGNPKIGGKTYPVSVSDGRELMAGMIFYNEGGDEIGGLVFNSFKMADGRIAGIGHLSFDRFNDNQVLSLEYNENKNGVRSGLTFYDRTGNGSFKKSLDLVEEAGLKTTTAERRSQIDAAFKEMKEKDELGAQRLFIGSRNEKAQIELKDKKGNVRGRFYVDDSGEARLEFLNAKGEITSVFPR